MLAGCAQWWEALWTWTVSWPSSRSNWGKHHMQQKAPTSDTNKGRSRKSSKTKRSASLVSPLEAVEGGRKLFSLNNLGICAVVLHLLFKSNMCRDSRQILRQNSMFRFLFFDRPCNGKDDNAYNWAILTLKCLTSLDIPTCVFILFLLLSKICLHAFVRLCLCTFPWKLWCHNAWQINWNLLVFLQYFLFETDSLSHCQNLQIQGVIQLQMLAIWILDKLPFLLDELGPLYQDSRSSRLCLKPLTPRRPIIRDSTRTWGLSPMQNNIQGTLWNLSPGPTIPENPHPCTDE